MGIEYEDLDEKTRGYMLEELNKDIDSESIYYSPRLNSKGESEWIDLLRNAIEHHDDEWLANQIRRINGMKSYEMRQESKAKVPKNAHETLAEGEFNRYYIRGLCRRAIDEGISDVEVYRGKEVRNPRFESQKKIGERFNSKNLLEDLRESPGVEPALGIPPGPNSGLTVKLP